MTMYITAASFEERCLALCHSLPDSQPGDSVVLIDFLGYENVSPYLLHRSKQEGLILEKGYRVVRMEAEVTSPLTAIMQLEKALVASGPSEVLLDISALPRHY